MTNEELSQWAATRADDAGRLAREVLSLRRQLEEARERNLLANERSDCANAELERFRSERSYVVGCNIGWEGAAEQAASYHDDQAAQHAACRYESDHHEMMAREHRRFASEIRALLAPQGKEG